MRLYIYRSSQASSVSEACRDGSIYSLGEMNEEQVALVKQIALVTADCMDSGEELVFVEERGS